MYELRPPRMAWPWPSGTVDSVCPFSGTGKSGPKKDILLLHVHMFIIEN